MRLKTRQAATNIHTDVVAAVGWTSSNEIYSVSDDKSIWRWSLNGEPQAKVCNLDGYCSDLHWFPGGPRKGQAGIPGADVFAIACTDGTFRILARGGREEKKVDAHTGAVIALRWNPEGTALVTAGEDGAVKLWSRSGMLRSTLVQLDSCVYSVAWGPDSEQVLFTSSKDLVVKPLQPSSKPLQWRAHEGVVLCVDWNAVNNVIVSGGEDCRYKVWDSFGRLLYHSSAADYAITSVAWSPDGELLAVGSFNSLRLCDRTGWAWSRQRPNAGSLLSIAWSADNTQVVAGGGNGALVIGQVIDRRVESKRLTATLEEGNRIRVQDMLSETTEELDFRDRVIKISLGYDHLVVATATQCCIYSAGNWNTPTLFDLKEVTLLLQQSVKHFLMVDAGTGMHVYSYEGRHVSNPKFQGLRTDCLNSQAVSLAPDVLAVIDRSDSKTVRFFEVSSGKALPPVSHSLELAHVALSQTGGIEDCKIVLVDRNRDLYISPVLKPALQKLAMMVESVAWHDTTEMLAAVVDLKLTLWYYPSVIFVDRDLLPQTKSVKEGSSFGNAPTIVSFLGLRVTVRRMDGALVVATVPPYPELLYRQVEAKQWEKATRLCRFVKDQSLWACLAVMAVAARELNTAHVAFAAIDAVDKLQYVLHIKEIPSEEGRNAELALFCRRPDEAESILLQAGLVFRAIRMHIRLFNWERALELALQYKTHIDTVLLYRAKYLGSLKWKETSPRFLQYASQVEVDTEKVRAKIQQEKEKEAQRTNSKTPP